MSFETNGYSRVYTTKGSLTSVFGGDETQRTSSSYDIPAGAVILRAPMMLSDAGSISMKQKPAGKMFVSVASGFSTTLKVAGSFTGTKVLDVE
mmetsp:Transcript_7349/g.17675  ORF Transcript_7349/g.17675 Transcript_7349/m.17675 type:complete len:93 (-) Transcript_7349:146-424(-)